MKCKVTKYAAFGVCSFLLSVLSITSARAEDANAKCVDKYEIFDNNTQVQVLSSGSSCYISVHPRDAFEDMIYRDYSFNEQGQLMVFDSYGDGAEFYSTAAREFYFFPRTKNIPTYAYDAAAKTLSVTDVSGKVFTFNTLKAVLTGVSGSKISQTYTIAPENKGGLEFLQNDGLWMDGGFKVGQSPSQDSKGKVVFSDSQGQKCELRNGDIYRYTSDGDATFKLSDSQLKKALTSRCPQMVLNF